MATPINFTVGNISFAIISASATSSKQKVNGSTIQNYCSVSIPRPPNFRILGGGARVDWKSGHNKQAFLTGIYPGGADSSDPTSWEATSKDHGGNAYATPHTLTAYAVCACMANGDEIPAEYYYSVLGSNQASVETPFWTTPLPADQTFSLVGGGARTTFSGYGLLLTASTPVAPVAPIVTTPVNPGSPGGWFGQSKDHTKKDYGSIFVYAIGLNTSFLTSNNVSIVYVPASSSDSADNPSLELAVANGQVIGGGGTDIYAGAGNMLVSSCFPRDSKDTLGNAWQVSGTDLQTADASTLNLIAIVASDISPCLVHRQREIVRTSKVSSKSAKRKR